MKFNEAKSSKRPFLHAVTIFLALLAVCGTTATALEPKTPDVRGDWAWNEHSIILGPAEEIMAFFGIPEPEGPVMRMICDAWGTLTIDQNGASFTGDTGQDGSCTTEGGQPALTTPFPPSFSITGFITGHAVHFDTGDLGGGIVCAYRGSLDVSDGIATELNGTGGCDVPLPFHPNMNKSLSFDATRL